MLVAAGLAEPLHLHLLELAGTENEVLGGDLIAEGLADLGDAEGNLDPAGGDYVLEIHIDALGGLRAEVYGRACIGIGPDMGGEHQVEVPRLGETVLRPTGRACTIEVDLVGTEAALALLAVNHRVAEV